MAHVFLTVLMLIIITSGHALLDSANEFLPPEPREMFRSEGGRVKAWAPDFEQLRTADFHARLVTLESGWLALPKYLDNPQLIYVLEGSARIGLTSPLGIPTNVRRVNRGDVVAIPRAWVSWWHNDGTEKLQIFCLVKKSEGPRPHAVRPSFLAGSQKRKVGGILRGFDRGLLARDWDVDLWTFDKTGILKFGRNPYRHAEDEGRSTNGGIFGEFKYALDESEPTMRVKDGSSLWSLDCDKFPILKVINLAITRFKLRPGALLAPRWLTKGAAIVYMINGRARFQMTFKDGRQAVDQDFRAGSLVVAPQGYPHTIWANSPEPAEFIALTNTSQPSYAFLAGKMASYNMPTGILATVLNEEPRLLKEEGHATWNIVMAERSLDERWIAAGCPRRGRLRCAAASPTSAS